jgi:cytochrome P450
VRPPHLASPRFTESAPEPFDITAQRTAQLTFGGGIHHCLGAGLARTEMREALPILASRLGDIALAGPVPSRPHIGITGPITLPLRFTGVVRPHSGIGQE